jgi:hypothetical protein
MTRRIAGPKSSQRRDCRCQPTLPHFTCNYEAWPTDKAGQKTAWTKIIRDTADNVREGGPVKFIGWVSNTEGYALLDANSKADVIKICVRFWPLFHNDIMEMVPTVEAGDAILAGVSES